MATLVFPDALPDLRYWLRNDPILNPLHGGRVFFRLPKTIQAPMLRLTQMGGALQNDGETPVQDLLLSVEIWGMRNSDYQAVRQISLALQHVALNYQPRSLANPTSNTLIDNVRVNAVFDSPDPETGWPRIICTLVVTVHALVPTII